MFTLDISFLAECKARLLDAREETVNHLAKLNEGMSSDLKDDTAADAFQQQQENYKFSRGRDLSLKLKQIDLALGRMDTGEYGICIETEEPIEKERLKLIPWTPLSIAGAEISEGKRRNY